MNYRKMMLKKHGMLYKRMYTFPWDKCAYCDGESDSLDHVPALSLLDGIDIVNYLKNGGKFRLYPCCLTCNRMLQATPCLSYYDRLDVLIKKYTKKLSKMTVWTEDELYEMGRNMKVYIQAHQAKIRYIQNKLIIITNKFASDEYHHLN